MDAETTLSPSQPRRMRRVSVRLPSSWEGRVLELRHAYALDPVVYAMLGGGVSEASVLRAATHLGLVRAHEARDRVPVRQLTWLVSWTISDVDYAMVRVIARAQRLAVATDGQVLRAALAMGMELLEETSPTTWLK